MRLSSRFFLSRLPITLCIIRIFYIIFCSLFQRPGDFFVDMQDPSFVQRRHVGRVRGDDVGLDVFLLRHDPWLWPGLGRVAHLVLVGMWQDRRHDVPAATARHAACRSCPPQFRSLRRGSKRLPAAYHQFKVRVCCKATYNNIILYYAIMLDTCVPAPILNSSVIRETPYGEGINI